MISYNMEIYLEVLKSGCIHYLIGTAFGAFVIPMVFFGTTLEQDIYYGIFTSCVLIMFWLILAFPCAYVRRREYEQL